jgi:chorismate mutase
MSELATEHQPLEAIREEIDGIDAQIVALWARRNELAVAVGEVKRENGTPIYAHSRDLEVRDRFGRLCEDNGIRRDLGQTVIGTLITSSYERQRSQLAD